MQGTYFGVFRDFQYFYKSEITELEPYGKEFADLYEMSAITQDELEIYNAEIEQSGKNVLELCCGNGRISIPLAMLGNNVDGYDNSQYMLDLLEAKKKQLDPIVQERINCNYGDIFSIQPQKKYNCIILAASTISILCEESNKLISLFTNMAQMTENNGRLIFDYPVNNSDRSSSQIISICRQTRDSISLILFQEFFNYIAGKIVSNIFFDIAYTNGEKKNISHV